MDVGYIRYEVVDGILLAQDRVQWRRVLVNMIMKLRVP